MTSSTSDYNGLNTSASTNLRNETSKIVQCVTKYCQAKLRSPRQATRARPPSAIDSLSYAEEVEAKTTNHLCADMHSDPVGEQTTSQVQVRVDAPELDDSAHSDSWQDHQDSVCKSCVVTENVDGSEPCCRWETLRVPALWRISVETYSDLKQSGNELFRRIVMTHDTSLVAQEEKLPSVWNYSYVFPAKESLCDNSQHVEPQALHMLSGPRRMPYDWCELRKPAENIVRDESNKVLQKVIQENAQATFFAKNVIVPSVFNGEWEISTTDNVDTGEPQQLLLPFNLVRDDEEKILRAPSKIISIASGYLRSLQRTDVSLTRASINAPCIWNHVIALNGLANLVSEDLKANDTRPISPTSSTCYLMPIPSQANSIEPKPAITSPKAKTGSGCNSLLVEAGPPHAAPVKPSKTDEMSTDYFLSDQFRLCNWSEGQDESMANDGTIKYDVNPKNFEKEPLKYNQLLQQLARPSLWDLMRKKLIQVDKTSFQRVLDCVSLEALEAIIYNQGLKARKMSLNPSGFSSTEIIEVCASLRQAAWLHTLRIVSISQDPPAQKGNMMAAILTRILPSVKYKLVLGSSNWKDFHTLLKVIGGRGVHIPPHTTLEPFKENEATSRSISNDLTLQPSPKRQKTFVVTKEKVPVRILCSVSFLQQDELLDELCTEQNIFFIERDLPTPIDMLVDERNCICVATDAMFKVETSMKSFIFSLARLQVQFQKYWLIIVLENFHDADIEDNMIIFHSALVQFRIEVQVLTSFSCEEAGHHVRVVIDQCAEVAFNEYRILPRMWFERPFLIEDESQFERFLVSTRIVNNYAAQSLLHKICMNDLFTKSMNELKILVQNSVTMQQLELLYRLMHQGHGLR